jgi:hypothetical protein
VTRSPGAPAAKESSSLGQLTVLDWIGAFLVGVSGLFGLAFPLFIGPVFRRLADSMGVAQPTGFFALVQGWAPAFFGLLPLTMVAYAVFVPQSLGRRRLVLLAAFALTVLESVVLLVSVYASLFNAMGTVQ